MTGFGLLALILGGGLAAAEESPPALPRPWEATPQAFGDRFPVMAGYDFLLNRLLALPGLTIEKILGLDAANATSLRKVLAARKAKIDALASLLDDPQWDEPTRTNRLLAALDSPGLHRDAFEREARAAMGQAGSRRLDQLRWQVAGPFGPLTAEHEAALGITAAQRERIDQAIRECAELKRKGMGEDPADVQRGARSPMRPVVDKLAALLDLPQRERWLERRGAAFPDAVVNGFYCPDANRDLERDRRDAVNSFNWRGHVQELMRPLESAAVRRWLELDEEQELRLEAMETARDEFEALFPRLIDVLPALEWQVLWELRERAACFHRYSDRVFKIFRPVQLKRFKALRFRMFGVGEMLNYYKTEFGVTDEHDKELEKGFEEGRKAQDREIGQQAAIARMTPSQRAKWMEYWNLPAPPEAVFNDAATMCMGDQHGQVRAREKHIPKAKAK